MVRMGSPVRFRRGAHIKAGLQKHWSARRLGSVGRLESTSHVGKRCACRRLSDIADGSDQGRCPASSVLHPDHSAPQRFKNAYVDASKGSHVQAATAVS
jgi:hypothetical protein